MTNSIDTVPPLPYQLWKPHEGAGADRSWTWSAVPAGNTGSPMWDTIYVLVAALVGAIIVLTDFQSGQHAADATAGPSSQAPGYGPPK